MKAQPKRLFSFTVMVAAVLLLTVGTPDLASASARQDSWWCLWWCRDNNPHYTQEEYGPEDHGVPEIDPGTAALAIGLVGGGLAILRDRRRRRC